MSEDASDATEELSALPTERLLARAAELSIDGDPESEERWHHVRALHLRGDEAIFVACERWSTDGEPRLRELGLDILAQLGCSGGANARPFASRSLPACYARLEDPDSGVRASALYAIGHLESSEAWDATPVRELASDPSAEVRHAVAYALGGNDTDLAVALLVQLSQDGDEEVRNWATFGLGTLSNVDSEEIRGALAERQRRGFGDSRRGDLRSRPTARSEDRIRHPGSTRRGPGDRLRRRGRGRDASRGVHRSPRGARRAEPERQRHSEGARGLPQRKAVQSSRRLTHTSTKPAALGMLGASGPAPDRGGVRRRRDLPRRSRGTHGDLRRRRRHHTTRSRCHRQCGQRADARRGRRRRGDPPRGGAGAARGLPGGPRDPTGGALPDRRGADHAGLSAASAPCDPHGRPDLERR